MPRTEQQRIYDDVRKLKDELRKKLGELEAANDNTQMMIGALESAIETLSEVY